MQFSGFKQQQTIKRVYHGEPIPLFSAKETLELLNETFSEVCIRINSANFHIRELTSQYVGILTLDKPILDRVNDAQAECLLRVWRGLNQFFESDLTALTWKSHASIYDEKERLIGLLSQQYSAFKKYQSLRSKLAYYLKFKLNRDRQMNANLTKFNALTNLHHYYPLKAKWAEIAQDILEVDQLLQDFSEDGPV